MGRTQDYEDQARAKIDRILHPGEQVRQVVRAMSSATGVRGGLKPALLAVTDRRLLVAPIASSQGAIGCTWRQVRDLRIRKKWISYAMEYTVQYGDLAHGEQFSFSYDISKKVAGPFLAEARQRWSVQHRQAAQRADAAVAPWYQRLLAGLSATQIAIACASAAVVLWAWWSMVVTRPQDFDAFLIVFAAAIGAGTLAQYAIEEYVHQPGSLRERLFFTRAGPGQNTSGVVYWGPLVVVVFGMLVATPPGTPTGDDSFPTIYAVIALMAVLGVIWVGLATLVLNMIIAPLGWFLGALLPDRRSKEEAARDPISTTEYVAMGGILMFTVLFAVSMTFIGDGSSPSDGTRTRMISQFIALVSLHGRLIPAIAAVGSIVGIVVLVVVANRAADTHRTRLLTRPDDPAGPASEI